jgi:hypothetical protein
MPELLHDLPNCDDVFRRNSEVREIAAGQLFRDLESAVAPSACREDFGDAFARQFANGFVNCWVRFEAFRVKGFGSKPSA